MKNIKITDLTFLIPLCHQQSQCTNMVERVYWVDVMGEPWDVRIWNPFQLSAHLIVFHTSKTASEHAKQFVRFKVSDKQRTEVFVILITDSAFDSADHLRRLVLFGWNPDVEMKITWPTPSTLVVQCSTNLEFSIKIGLHFGNPQPALPI